MSSTDQIKLREITLDELLQKFVMDGNVYLKLSTKNLKIKSYGAIFSEKELERYRNKTAVFHFESLVNQSTLMKARNGLKMFLGNKDLKEKKQAAKFILGIFKDSLMKKNVNEVEVFNFFYAFYLEFFSLDRNKLQRLDEIDQDIFRSFFTMAAIQVIHLIILGYDDYNYFKEHYNNVFGHLAGLSSEQYDYWFRQDLSNQLEKHHASEEFLKQLKNLHQPQNKRGLKNEWIKQYGDLLTEDRRSSGPLKLDHSHLLDWESSLISTYAVVGFIIKDWDADGCRQNIQNNVKKILESKKASRYLNAKLANFYLRCFSSEILSKAEAS
jgi:hypothetical protein